MTLEQVQQTLLILLNKANKSGAFELEEANAGIQALNALAQLINQQQQSNQANTIKGSDIVANYNRSQPLSAASDDPDNPPIPHDPSKP